MRGRTAKRNQPPLIRPSATFSPRGEKDILKALPNLQSENASDLSRKRERCEEMCRDQSLPARAWSHGRRPSGLSRRHTAGNWRRGMTLVELLVVVTILIVLMGVALPLMRPALEENRIREASRQLNALVQTAKMKAAETGRDYGLWIERSTVESNSAFEVYLAEVPRPYAGDLVGARVGLVDAVLANGTAGQDGVVDRLEFLLSDTASMLQLVQAGDRIQLDYKGPLYRIQTSPAPVPASNPARLFVLFSRTDPGDPMPLPVGGDVPFQITRLPVKVATRPLQFSGGVILDLQHSGMGYARGNQFAAPAGNTTPVVMMFRPSGTMAQVIARGVAQAPSATVHLLLGRLAGREAFEPEANSANPIDWSSTDPTQITYSKNLADHKSIWVAVGNRNGTVSTSPNGWELAPVAPWPPNTPGGSEPPYMENSLDLAREFAQTGQTDGGG